MTEDPADLLLMAKQLLTRASPETAGLWPRAAALLARNALETAIDNYWSRRRIALESCPTFQQLICLREYLGDEELAGRVHHAWNELSRACHHHPYELSPTVGELGAMLETVGQLLTLQTAEPTGEAIPASGAKATTRQVPRTRK
jgi:hypothetical protein